MKTIKYRIVKDEFAGFECQVWYIWFPFWTQLSGINSHSDIERAKKYIEENTGTKKTKKTDDKVVWKSNEKSLREKKLERIVLPIWKRILHKMIY